VILSSRFSFKASICADSVTVLGHFVLQACGSYACLVFVLHCVYLRGVLYSDLGFFEKFKTSILKVSAFYNFSDSSIQPPTSLPSYMLASPFKLRT